MTAPDIYAAARATATQAARRQAEQDAEWDAYVEQALRLAGDHSLALAEHTGRVMRLVEGDGDE